MSTTILEDKDTKSRYDALNECELKIAKASKDTVESIRIIGTELRKIEAGELWEVTQKADFKEYVEICMKWDYRLARAWMRASETLELLAEQKLQLPYNQSQVLELAKIKEPETMVRLWQKVLDVADELKVNATYDMVRDAVTAQRTKTNERLTRARTKSAKKPGIQIDLEPATNGEAPARTVWSEEGEKALNRIRRLCGDPIADAIDSGNPRLNERDLIRWAQEETEMVKNLAHWIVIKRWSLRKALAYEESSIDMDTTVEELGDFARSRGGRAYFEVEDLKLTVEVGS